MMLDHLGEEASASKILNAIEHVTREQIVTPDLGGTATTEEVTEAIIKQLKR